MGTFDNGWDALYDPSFDAPVDEMDDGKPLVTFTKRTNDPKLAAIQRILDSRGIPSRREGESAHAPILKVRESDQDAAWELLGEADSKHGTFDDVPDDDPRWEQC